jgi:hypothetical protein
MICFERETVPIFISFLNINPGGRFCDLKGRTRKDLRLAGKHAPGACSRTKRILFSVVVYFTRKKVDKGAEAP